MLLPLTGKLLYCIIVRMCLCMYVCVCMCACMYVSVHVCVCMCVHVRVCQYLCTCVCIYTMCTCICVRMLRRNHHGDKDKALTVMEELLKQQENQVPDFLCLCGRIYKDKFVESDYSDNESRDQAIYW